MKLDLIRSNRNPVHVSVFQDIGLNSNDWNVIPLTTLFMPIRIWRITFDFRTTNNDKFTFFARLVRETENLLIVGSSLGSVFSKDSHAWINCIALDVKDSLSTDHLNMYIIPFVNLGLSNFNSLDIYPIDQGANPIQVTVYIGWSYR
jgi:hypothetical protein